MVMGIAFVVGFGLTGLQLLAGGWLLWINGIYWLETEVWRGGTVAEFLVLIGVDLRWVYDPHSWVGLAKIVRYVVDQQLLTFLFSWGPCATILCTLAVVTAVSDKPRKR